MIIKPLPSWVIVNPFPGFYESESLTAVEQTARVYKKVQELVESYNQYIEQVNTELMELEKSTDKDLNCAIETLINLTDSYISTVDMKLIRMNRTLAENYVAFTDNVIKTTQDIIADLKEKGELDTAILDAVGGLNEKFTVIHNEWGAKKQEIDNALAGLQNQYNSHKSELDYDYNTTKTRLEQDYQAVKSTLCPECLSGVVYETSEKFNGNTVYKMCVETNHTMNNPQTFPISLVIDGMNANLSGMKVCSLECLAYGIPYNPDMVGVSERWYSVTDPEQVSVTVGGGIAALNIELPASATVCVTVKFTRS